MSDEKQEFLPVAFSSISRGSARGRKRMRKQTALKIVNPIMFLLVIYQGITGLFKADMYTHFKAVHPIAGALLLLFAALHLILNWPWVKSQYIRNCRK